MTATWIDPKEISNTLKEAVVDSLLNSVVSRVSGGGSSGRILYGTKPSQQLSSGFILPLGSTELDEVTSPIWIGAHGLDLQVDASVTDQRIHVKPRLSIYVRLLPTRDDLQREDCQLQFVIRKKIRDEMREHLTALRNKWWQANGGNYKYRSQHPEWSAIQRETQRAAYTAVGLPPDISLLESVVDESHADVGGDDLADSLTRAVPESSKTTIPDHLVQPSDLPHKWYRLDVDVPPIVFNPALSNKDLRSIVESASQAMRSEVQSALDGWVQSDDPVVGGKMWGHRQRTTITPSQYNNWDNFIDEVRQKEVPVSIPELNPAWDIQSATDWLNPNLRNVHIALENRSDTPASDSQSTEVALFQVALEIELPRQLHAPLLLGRVEPSYRYNRYLQYPALGFNAGVEAVTDQSSMVRLRTTWQPRYVQPRIRPIAQDRVNLNIAALAQSDGLKSIDGIGQLFREWIDGLSSWVDPSAGLPVADEQGRQIEHDEYVQDVEKWKAEAAAIQVGIDLLKDSKSAWSGSGPQANRKAAVFEAWLAMNETMAEVAKAKKFEDWRLFQIAFILATIPSLATRERAFGDYFDERRDESVSLLYFATGGGKSEAFLGLLVFALFFDRLRGKQRGVTAMLRYPLRLLTIQQAQRTAKVLAVADRIRYRQRYPGRSFEIGFWVGSGGSPNRLNAEGISDLPLRGATKVAEAELRRDKHYESRRLAWSKLPSCPYCDSLTGLRRATAKAGPVVHVCTSAACFSNVDGPGYLPFYVVDEDIYAYAPAVILGTVDKLALIGHTARTIRRILGMFGAASWIHKGTDRLHVPTRQELQEPFDDGEFDKVRPSYVQGLDIFYDPFPSLIIQDEAHLLEESLGSFSGIFESTLDTMLDSLARSFPEGLVAKYPNLTTKRRRAKIVAASATVSHPERQLEHLYQRATPCQQFPYPGPDLYKSFYASPVDPIELDRAESNELTVETRAQHARVYAALLTNGKPHTTTTVAVLAEFHCAITLLLTRLISGDDAQEAAARRDLVDHLSPRPLRDLYARALSPEGSSANELATLIDLHRISLTYVTNKKGGDQILAAEEVEVSKRHRSRNLSLGTFVKELISGSVEQGKIQSVVQIAQTRPSPNHEIPGLDGQLRSIVATSAVSHGVDVDEFNSMFFAGLPSDIAEYIQASSRIGRTHVGFCLLIPTPQRRRDRYVVEVFDSFHRFLERMVQPAAIDRWAARAVDRCMPSVYQAYVCGVLPACELICSDDQSIKNLSDFSFTSDVERRYRREKERFLQEVSTFAYSAIGLRDGYKPLGEEFYRKLVDQRVTEITRDLASTPAEAISKFFQREQNSLRRPMTSLRDVDQAGLITPAIRKRGANEEALTDLMAFIQHGIVASEDDCDEEEGT